MMLGRYEDALASFESSLSLGASVRGRAQPC
jgi:hypothetical protein